MKDWEYDVISIGFPGPVIHGLAGADVKDAQALMRHSRASTTLDIYQQFVPESQRRVVEQRDGQRHVAIKRHGALGASTNQV